MFDIFKSITIPTGNIISQLPQALIVFAIGVVAIVTIKTILNRVLAKSPIGQSASNIISAIVSFLLWVILSILILKSLGLTSLVIALSGMVAIVGLALANGGRNLVSDILSGITLAFDKDFNIGDHVKTDETEGEVVVMDIRKVRIKDKDGNLHVMPNSFVEKKPWVLYKKEKEGE